LQLIRVRHAFQRCRGLDIQRDPLGFQSVQF